MTKSDLKDLALQMKIPIITDEGLLFLIELIKENNIKDILEIGTGIGYSAVMLSEHVNSITTIERNIYMYKIAKMNLDKFKDNNIKLINIDALDYNTDSKYDLIFIDAAKAQYERFFKKFQNNLNEGGIIVCDNLNFHNLDMNKVSKNTRALLRKLNNFKSFLKNNKEFETTFYELGDGMTISRRNK